MKLIPFTLLAQMPVSEAEYFIVAAPLKIIRGTDAAPARVLLFEGIEVK